MHGWRRHNVSVDRYGTSSCPPVNVTFTCMNPYTPYSSPHHLSLPISFPTPAPPSTPLPLSRSNSGFRIPKGASRAEYQVHARDCPPLLYHSSHLQQHVNQKLTSLLPHPPHLWSHLQQIHEILTYQTSSFLINLLPSQKQSIKCQLL